MVPRGVTDLTKVQEAAELQERLRAVYEDVGRKQLNVFGDAPPEMKLRDWINQREANQ